MVIIANDLRKIYGADYIVKYLYEKARKTEGDCIIESIRVPLEAEALQILENFYLFAVDADPIIRYERSLKRGTETDNITYEKFVADEKLEMTSTDSAKQNLSKCIKMANYKFLNNGNLEDLYKQVEKVVETLKK